MITIQTSKDGLSILCGKTPVAVFPKKVKDGTLSLLSHPEETPTKGTVSWPGEYDIDGITLRGIGHREGQAVSYLIASEGVRIAAPCLPLEEWTEHEIELLGDVHILLLPASDPKICQRLLDEVDPRVLVLLPAEDGTLHPDVLKMCAAVGKESVSEYKVKGTFAAEGREVVVMG